MRRWWWAVLWMTAALGACKKPASPAPVVVDAGASEDGERQTRRRFKDAHVYVDGQPVAVLKYMELPPSLEPVILERSATKRTIRFSLARYVECLGLDLSKVKAVHLYGGRGRLAALSAVEVNKHREDLLFQFTQQVTGKPRMSWPETGVDVNTHLDIISDVAIYVAREPPAWSNQAQQFVLPDGKPVDGIPYVPAQDVGGSRVYLDGKLVTFMRRTAAVDVDGKRSDGKTDFLQYLSQRGVDLSKVRTVDVIDEDTRLIRIPLNAQLHTLEFSFPARSQGRVQIHVPTQTPDADPLLASAIRLWTSENPPERGDPRTVAP